MSISSKTLFHFTSKSDYLVDILKNGFWPRFCPEFCWGDKDLAIPMVCFCDIPLSQILHHINKYGGGYGIGVSKQWAVSKGITPILYLSYENRHLYVKIKEYAKKMEESSDEESEIKRMLLYYAKRVTASKKEKAIRKDTKNIKFYNEREWRYIPKIDKNLHLEILNPNPSDDRNLERYRIICNQLSEQTKSKKLPIEYKDVKYLFVPDEKSKSDFVTLLQEEFNDERLMHFISNIITVESIKNDF